MYVARRLACQVPFEEKQARAFECALNWIESFILLNVSVRFGSLLRVVIMGSKPSRLNPNSNGAAHIAVLDVQQEETCFYQVALLCISCIPTVRSSLRANTYDSLLASQSCTALRRASLFACEDRNRRRIDLVLSSNRIANDTPLHKTTAHEPIWLRSIRGIQRVRLRGKIILP